MVRGHFDVYKITSLAEYIIFLYFLASAWLGLAGSTR
jgi:hypothetical protein